MPGNELGMDPSLNAEVDRLIYVPQITGQVVFVIGVFLGRFGSPPTYPKLGVTAVLFKKGAIGIVLVAFLQVEGLPTHADVQVIGRPNIALLGCTQLARGKKSEA